MCVRLDFAKKDEKRFDKSAKKMWKYETEKYDYILTDTRHSMPRYLLSNLLTEWR